MNIPDDPKGGVQGGVVGSGYKNPGLIYKNAVKFARPGLSNSLTLSKS
jgi:hypothetical protein